MNVRTNIWATAVLALMVMSLSGCGRTQPWGSRPDPLPPGQHPQVVLHDDVHNRVSHGDPVVTPSDGQTPMRVTVPIRLLDNREYSIQYRFRFFDERGRSVQPEMGWRYTTLPPRAQTQVEAAALNPSAVDWRLEIRLAR